MRIRLAACLAVLSAAGAEAQSLSVELLTHLSGQAETNLVLGPVDMIYVTPDGSAPVPPVPMSTPLTFEQWSYPPITAETGQGATQITFPAQSVQLLPASNQMITCPYARPCTLLHANPPNGIEFQLAAFTVMLTEPVPDPEGGCRTLDGYMSDDLTAQALGGAPLEFSAIPPVSPPLPLPPPSQLVAGQLERHLVQPPVNARFSPLFNARVRVCGDVPDPREGVLTYQVIQRGSTWSWTSSGRWNFSIQDNGAAGAGHYATVQHTLLSDSFEGTLINVAPGPVGMLQGAVERINDPAQEALWELDPASHPGPDAIGYRMSFDPDPGLALKSVLRFSEPPGLPNATGRINTLEVNNSAAIALSYFFREVAVGFEAELDVTPYGPEEYVPVAHGGPGAPFQLEISFSWELPEP